MEKLTYIREFFKPSVAKLMLFLLIFLASIFSVQLTSYYFVFDQETYCLDCSFSWDACRYDYFLPLWPLLQLQKVDNLISSKNFVCPLGKVYGFEPYENLAIITPQYLLVLIPHFFYWYFISCLIILIYNKYSRKGGKKRSRHH